MPIYVIFERVIDTLNTEILLSLELSTHQPLAARGIVTIKMGRQVAGDEQWSENTFCTKNQPLVNKITQNHKYMEL